MPAPNIQMLDWTLVETFEEISAFASRNSFRRRSARSPTTSVTTCGSAAFLSRSCAIIPTDSPGMVVLRRLNGRRSNRATALHQTERTKAGQGCQSEHHCRLTSGEIRGCLPHLIDRLV